MPEAELRYSLNEVKRAGKFLRQGEYGVDVEVILHALEVFENWQACHSFPLNWFYDSMCQYASLSSPLTNVVQRRKRLDAVLAKLRREPQSQLSTMQDIAGCRAIVNRIEDIEPFMSVCREGWIDHRLHNTDDYIATPNPRTGYRGIHLIYRFKHDDKSFDGRNVEIQFRSRLQHAWATAVEIVDLFQSQSLKFGTGDPDWTRFFLLMSSAIARMEDAPTVPNTPSGNALRDELRRYAESLRVEERMEGWGSAALSIDAINKNFTGVSGYSGSSGRSGYFVIELDKNLKAEITGFAENDVARAYQYVAMIEKANPNVVLVAARNLERLREAYPNWLLDTHNFVMILKTTILDDFT